MKSSIKNFDTGWYGLNISLSECDIENLIEYLQLLKNDHSYHFHLYSTAFDTDSGGVADIQFTREIESEKSNMKVGG